MSLFQRLISRACPESTSRALSIWAGWALIGIAVPIGLSIAARIIWKSDVGGGAVAALIAVVGPLVTMVTVNYRAKASGNAAPESAGAVGGAAPAPNNGGSDAMA